jgi:HSP20 family protein
MTNIIKRTKDNMPMPFSGLVDRMLNNSISRFFDDDFWGFTGLTGVSHIPVNIRETDKTYEMELAAPGLNKEDFNISVSGNTLTVSLEEKEENKDEDRDKGWVRQEYSYRGFTRSFNLGDEVDVNGITAEYTNGILHLSLPKKEGTQRLSRQIKIK